MQRLRIALLAALIALVAIAGTEAHDREAPGARGGSYAIAWSTVDGGGLTTSAGGTFALGGTAGQPDAGSMSGGRYRIDGGFWHGSDFATNGRIFVPLLNR